jgi:hypothetical protein
LRVDAEELGRLHLYPHRVCSGRAWVTCVVFLKPLLP